jgi:glycosyltransferase involved in cell wall biosynthesis
VRYFVRDVLPTVRRTRPDARLVVTGSTDGADLDGLSARDGVEFTGRLPEVDAVVAGSEVCVVPLRIGGGTRLKVLKAMALGTPVVSTARGIEGLEVQDGRHLLVGADAAEFASRVVALLEEPARGATLAAEARRLVSDVYDWERVGALWEQVIEGAVAREL